VKPKLVPSAEKDATQDIMATALANRETILREMDAQYRAHLDAEMGKLHDRFVVFVSASNLPLPQVLLVLELLVRETIDQAKQQYMGA
jgi:hypothetical protein